MVVVLALGAAPASAAPASAPPSSRDVATTRVLASATDALVRAANPEVSQGLAAAQSYARKTAGECPNAAAGSPQNHEAEQLDDEVIGAMTVVGYRIAARPIATFASRVHGLRWSNGRLTRAVKTFTTKLSGLTRLATPNVCGDLRAWAASGYQTVPASTVAFDQTYYRVSPDAEEAPLIIRLATPYAVPSELPVLRRVERLETKLGEAEAAAVDSYSRLIMALELKQ